MCRFFGLLGTGPGKVDWHLVRAKNALVAKSRQDQAGNSHRDGWGIGYYVGRFPIVAWSASPAAEDNKFLITARAIASHAVIAHVRDASVGLPSLANTHPFTHGPWLFAHNGTVRNFAQVAPTLIAEIDPSLQVRRLGDTDSELVFYWLLSRLMRAGINPGQACGDLPQLARIVAAAVPELARRCEPQSPDEPTRLNFLLTDGTVLLASRWRHSVFWAERLLAVPRRHHRHHAVIVASEAIDDDPWQEIPDASLLTVNASLQTSVRLLSPPIIPALENDTSEPPTK